MKAKMEHVFSHLGKAPYKFKGYQELLFIVPGCAPRAGGSCDHCGTGIRNAYFFESADGKTFKVGSSCVKKCGDKGLRKAVTDQERKMRHAKNIATYKKLQGELVTLVEQLGEKLDKERHPHDYYWLQGKTLRDYVTYVERHGSLTATKGLVKMLRGL